MGCRPCSENGKTSQVIDSFTTKYPKPEITNGWMESCVRIQCLHCSDHMLINIRF